MKGLFPKIGVVGIIVAFVPISFCLEAWAADKKEIERQIKNQVDEVVTGIDSGKKVEDYKLLAKKDPYFVFIMEQSGNVLFHPAYEGRNMQNISGPVYEVLIKGTTEGLWVKYDYYGIKHTYVRKTKGGLFVASGYKE